MLNPDGARPGEITILGLTAVFGGNDVIRFVGKQRVFFVEQAVFASPPCPLPDQGTQGSRHILAHRFDAFLERSRALTNCTNISACSY